MSHRLQVILNPKELSIIKKAAHLEKKSVSDWVRGIIREKLSRKKVESEIDPIQALSDLRLPASPIDQMLEEIEEGRF
ncbi:MAG: hypothetical protein HYT76_07185 [Deltaproteobacteria bacterium]|nr:hypothetical protein [Deltaproteobacteria bacterium]